MKDCIDWNGKWEPSELFRAIGDFWEKNSKISSRELDQDIADLRALSLNDHALAFENVSVLLRHATMTMLACLKSRETIREILKEEQKERADA